MVTSMVNLVWFYYRKQFGEKTNILNFVVYYHFYKINHSRTMVTVVKPWMIL